MKKLLLIQLAALLMLSACGGAKQPEADTPQATSITVNVDQAKRLTDSILNIRVQRVDTTAQSLFGVASIALMSGDTIFILDQYKNRGLFAYDNTGKFLWAYDKVGQGPGEFLQLTDFEVLPGRIAALDMMANKIINLDRGGNFVSSDALGGNLYPSSFGYTGDSRIWLDLGNRPAGVRLVTIEDTDTTTVMTTPEYLKGFGMSAAQPLYTVGGANGQLHYLPSLESTIYLCADTTATPLLSIDFGAKWPKPDMFDKTIHSMQVFNNIKEQGYVCYLNALENDTHYCLTFIANNDHRYILLVNKDTANSTLYDTAPLFKDAPSVIMPDGTLLYISDDAFKYLSVRLP